MRVSILIPVYNEFVTFPMVLERVLCAPLPPGCEKEIVVVNDGSTDGTAELIGKCCPPGAPIYVHHARANRGKGAALRLALEKATGEIVLVQDGDLEYDPRDYLALLLPIVEGRAGVVYGSRFLGRVRGMRRRNRLANRILTIAANLLFGARITDEATAYKAFRAGLLRQIRLEADGFEFCPEVTAKLRRIGCPIYEVPISYYPRQIGEGKKIRARDGFRALWTLLRYRFAPLTSFYRGAPLPAGFAAAGAQPH